MAISQIRMVTASPNKKPTSLLLIAIGGAKEKECWSQCPSQYGIHVSIGGETYIYLALDVHVHYFASSY